MKTMDLIVATLVIVGGLNWGLVGIAHFDLVAALLGAGSALSRVVYALVGVSALYQAITWRAIQRRWSPASVRA
jgi:uncharacterized membrane protein YuzA (DUF378 family)